MTEASSAAPQPDTDPAESLRSRQTERATARRNAFIKALALYILPAVFILLAVAAVYKVGMLITEGKATAADPVATAPGSLPVASAPSGETARLQSEIAALRAELARQQGGAASPGGTVVTPDATALAFLSERLDRLEAAQAQITRNADVVRAANALQIAALGSAPFPNELIAAERALSDPSVTIAIKPLAEQGVPSLSALVVSYPNAAARAAAAGHSTDPKTGKTDFFGRWIGSFLSVRRTDVVAGSGVDAVLARAEISLNHGDLPATVKELERLPAPAHRAMASWLEHARNRILIEQTTRRMTDLALSRLATPPVVETPRAGGAL